MPCSSSYCVTRSNNLFRPRPPALLVLLVFACLSLLLSRVTLPCEESPALAFSEPSGIWVELGNGFVDPGVHQFSDGTTISDVINLTGLIHEYVDVPVLTESAVLRSGERLDILSDDKKVTAFRRCWMSSWARMTLGVPLHPDQMSRTDWLALPGVGVRLAERIELDRQNNGDFGGLFGLRRVSGIGAGRIKSWETFFFKI